MTLEVGMIGLGIMGSAMSGNLLQSGIAVVGFDVLPERMEALAAKGGQACTSPRDAAAKAEILITVLPSVAALEAVVTGRNGLLSSGRNDLVVVECSTLPIEAKLKAHAALRQAGIVMLDCPLSGTGAQAAEKDLVVYGSGEQAAYERCVPVFDGFSRANYYLGAFGNGCKMKYVANLLVAIHNVAAAEALVLGMKAGLDPELIYRVIRDGAGTSRMFEVRGLLMVKGDYDTATMKNDVWQKDLQIIGDFARALACPTPLMSASTQLYIATLAQGRDKQDTAAVCAVMEELAHLDRKKNPL